MFEYTTERKLYEKIQKTYSYGVYDGFGIVLAMSSASKRRGRCVARRDADASRKYI